MVSLRKKFKVKMKSYEMNLSTKSQNVYKIWNALFTIARSTFCGITIL